jgi:hypothetical protein
VWGGVSGVGRVGCGGVEGQGGPSNHAIPSSNPIPAIRKSTTVPFHNTLTPRSHPHPLHPYPTPSELPTARIWLGDGIGIVKLSLGVCRIVDRWWGGCGWVDWETMGVSGGTGWEGQVGVGWGGVKRCGVRCGGVGGVGRGKDGGGRGEGGPSKTIPSLSPT